MGDAAGCLVVADQDDVDVVVAVLGVAAVVADARLRVLGPAEVGQPYHPQRPAGDGVVDPDLLQQHRSPVRTGGMDAEEVPIGIRGQTGHAVWAEPARGQHAKPEVTLVVQRSLVVGHVDG